MPKLSFLGPTVIEGNEAAELLTKEEGEMEFMGENLSAERQPASLKIRTGRVKRER